MGFNARSVPSCSVTWRSHAEHLGHKRDNLPRRAVPGRLQEGLQVSKFRQSQATRQADLNLSLRYMFICSVAFNQLQPLSEGLGGTRIVTAILPLSSWAHRLQKLEYSLSLYWLERMAVAGSTGCMLTEAVPLAFLTMHSH